MDSRGYEFSNASNGGLYKRFYNVWNNFLYLSNSNTYRIVYTLANKKQSLNNIKQYNYDRNRVLESCVTEESSHYDFEITEDINILTRN